ncbi:hypothetical protein [Paraburkholderia rhizosphaerae]|uniref:hypothetical protein n=1 Tax=Paraburkholderia rhizosphaerae TaxID=480658 RepID=UPI001064983F|nr:hypothetical protein [Paraburkholderia rhizosphaerae]
MVAGLFWPADGTAMGRGVWNAPRPEASRKPHRIRAQCADFFIFLGRYPYAGVVRATPLKKAASPAQQRMQRFQAILAGQGVCAILRHRANMFIVLTASHLHFAVRPGIGAFFARPLAA